MFQLKILRKFLLPGAVCAAPVLAAGEEKATSDVNKPVENISKTDSCEHCRNTPSKLRPSELPLYGGEQEKRGRVENVVVDPSGLEQTIGAVRKEVWVFYDQYKGYQQKVLEVVDTGKAHAESTLGFLREEATSVHRAGAIGLGGLAGFVMGLRSGVFKRTFYATAGAAAMTALCYPREAAEIADETLQISKYYFIIAYNFICGANPDGFKFLSSSSAAHSNKLSAEGSAAPVPDKTALPVDKEKPPPSAPVSQVEEHSKCKQSPSLTVTSEVNSNVSSSCPRSDPAACIHKAGYTSNSDELDKLGEMISDVGYWGFRFVNMAPLYR